MCTQECHYHHLNFPALFRQRLKKLQKHPQRLFELGLVLLFIVLF